MTKSEMREEIRRLKEETRSLKIQLLLDGNCSKCGKPLDKEGDCTNHDCDIYYLGRNK